MSWRDWLKHAFATAGDSPCRPTPEQDRIIDTLCRGVIRRQMTLPAQMLLDSCGPLGSLAGQSLPMLHAWMGLFLTDAQIQDLTRFLEHPRAIDYLAQRLEQLEQETQRPRDVTPPSAGEAKEQA